MAKRYGPWEVIRPLGEGGQGQVYLVRDTRNAEAPLRALKRLVNKERLDRFRQEVQTALNLKHENIIRVEEYDLDGEKPYFLAEFCSQGSLRKAAVQSWPLPQRLRLFERVCRAVGFAHGQSVIHRDLKPDNILLRETGEPVVADFGICFATPEGERITLTEEVVGPRHYTAPELEAGRSGVVHPNVDVYSLGKVLYWLTSGRDLPRERHREEPFDLSRSRDPEIFHIYEILDRAIVEDPAKRFQNGYELAEAAAASLNRVELGARPLTMKARQPCIFCKNGEYRLKFSRAMWQVSTQPGYSPRQEAEAALRGLGYFPAGDPPVLILACENCGHLAIFRPDQGKNPSGWDETQ